MNKENTKDKKKIELKEQEIQDELFELFETLTEKQISDIWNSVFSCSESIFCRDPWGKTMARNQFNKREKYGWTIDFLDLNITNLKIENLQPLHWESKLNKKEKIYKKWSRVYIN